MLTQLTNMAGVILALSVAVERVIEILKGWIPWLGESSAKPKVEAAREGLIHALAAVVGAISAWLCGINPITQLVPNAPNTHWHRAFDYVIAGLLSSFGSAFWNHLLDILAAIKEGKEAATAALVNGTPTPPAATP